MVQHPEQQAYADYDCQTFDDIQIPPPRSPHLFKSYAVKRVDMKELGYKVCKGVYFFTKKSMIINARGDIDMNKKMLTYGLVVGGVVGAATALLSAPLSGKDLRKQVKEAKNEWIRIANEFKVNAAEMKDSVTKLSKEGTAIIKELATDVKSVVEEWQQDIEPTKESMQQEIKNIQQTIADLEKKLQKGKNSST